MSASATPRSIFLMAGVVITAPAFAGELVQPLEAAPGTATVVATGKTFGALQAAVDALPETGGEITLTAGVYREKVLVTRPNVRLRGLGRKANDVVITCTAPRT